jgi:hypothetical protein
LDTLDALIWLAALTDNNSNGYAKPVAIRVEAEDAKTLFNPTINYFVIYINLNG